MYKGQIRLGNLCQATFWKSDLCLDTYVKIVISCLCKPPRSLMKYPAGFLLKLGQFVLGCICLRLSYMVDEQVGQELTGAEK